jgi:tetratricopeptide (TPR) repeat protein
MPRIALKSVLAVGVIASSILALAACGGAQARKAKYLEKGNAFMKAENYEKARVEFQNALQIAPVDPDARFDMGLVDEKLGKPREAAQFYQGTIDVKPDHVGARTNLARLYLFSAAPDRALELIKPALEKNPDDAELLTLRAAARMQLKDTAAALVDAERAVELKPMNEDAVSALAGIYVFDKTPEKARTLLEDSIKKIPTSVGLRMTLAQVYAKEERPADVERVLLEIVRLQPKDTGPRIRLAQFYAQQNQLDAAERVLREGIAAIPDDRNLKLSLVDFLSVHRSAQSAETELQSMIGAAPKDTELKFALAKFYIANKQPERAEEIYRKVIDSEEWDAAGIAARDRLASLRAQRNDLKGTQELVAEVLAKSPRDSDALILRGDVALANQDPKAAIADLRTVLRDQPNSVGVLRTLARAHLANGEPAIAEETLQRALESNPNDGTLRLDLAQLLAQTGKTQQAKTILTDLVKQQPNNVPALDTLFRVSMSLKDPDTATSAAETLVTLQPKSALGYLYEGMVSEQQQRSEDALRAYRQAAALDPGAFEPLQAESRLLVNMKRAPEAMKQLDEITAGDPKNAFAPNIKGEILMMQADPTGAQSAFKMAIARAPTWWVPYRNLAAAQFTAKDPEAAVATLRTAESAVSQPDQIGLELAAYYERNGKPEAAIREYDAIIKRNPKSDVAANNLAMLLVSYGKDAASIDRAKTLASRFADSSNPSYLDTYGWVLFKHGEAVASASVLQHVASLGPSAPVVLYHLGMAQSQSGSNAQARENLLRAINSGTKFLGLDEAKATLDSLPKTNAEPTPKS